MEIFSIISILILSVVLFFIIRTMDMIDNYNQLGLIVKTPIKCKKCHIVFSIFRTCKHAKHSISTPFLACTFALFCFLFVPLVIVPYLQSLPPIIEDSSTWSSPSITWGYIWDEYVAPLLKV